MTDALQQAWAVYAGRALPANADINQRASAKQAFYNGAIAAAQLLTDAEYQSNDWLALLQAADRVLDEDGFIVGDAIDAPGPPA